jgi:hypothetical protein
MANPRPLSAEAAFLHAVIEEDPDHAKALLKDFSGSELVVLYRVLGEAGEMVAAEHQARGPHASGMELGGTR